MQIEVSNLSYRYGEKKSATSTLALDDVSITINEGEFFGIIGKTGSGKSTFVLHLNGLLKVQKNSGKVVIGEYDLTEKKCNFKQLRSKVGMVFQYPEYQLFAETVKEDVAFGLKNFFPDEKEDVITEKTRQAIELVGLDYDKVANKSPFELSGGQKRRVAIAGVIVTQPEILVLDEPAAGLDPVGKRDFLSLLHALHKNFVKTIVIVSHDMNLVSENCDRVAVFSDGKIVKTGTPKEIFADDNIIEQTELDIPVTEFLTRRLKGKGVEINSDLTIADFVDKFATKYVNKTGENK